jgi:membrane-bound metal-dependent hydrolase YbcI (DUF457 family)
MAQAGMHALVGVAAGKISPKREWLILGIILGNLFPDLDNYAVAVATVTGVGTEGLHRTFTHSALFIVAVVLIFYAVAQIRKQPRWFNLGMGLGVGIAMHAALDLLIWFNGVELLSPLGGWVNFWESIDPPAWFMKLMEPLEFLFFALYFGWLAGAARGHRTDGEFLPTLRLWTIAMIVLLVAFAPLTFITNGLYFTIYGAAYLVSLTAAFVITIRMRQTVAASGGSGPVLSRQVAPR